MTTNKDDSQDETLLRFPCEFTIKIVGLANDEFDACVKTIVHKHIPNFSDDMIHSRLSKGSKYKALNIVIDVTSKRQLDDLYQELSSSPQVIMAL